MKLFPQNLRERQHDRVVRQRMYSAYGESAKTYIERDPKPAKLGFLGRLWAKGQSMTEAQAARANASSGDSTQGYAYLTASLGSFLLGTATLIMNKKGVFVSPEMAWAAFLAGSAGITALGFGPIGKATLAHLHQELGVSEVEGLIADSTDELDRAFLDLVRVALLQEIPDPPEKNVRAAIEALGAALDRLPAFTLQPLDPVALRTEAGQLRTQAIGEPDSVTADSLERRAAALEQRASAHERTALLSRRTSALRAELLAQIEALRETLGTSSSSAGTVQVEELARLSESALRVAAETNAAASAREELSGYLGPAQATPSEVEKLRLGR